MEEGLATAGLSRMQSIPALQGKSVISIMLCQLQACSSERGVL